MKKLLFLISITLLVTTCTTQTFDPTEILDSYAEAMNNFDLDTLQRIMHTNAIVNTADGKIYDDEGAVTYAFFFRDFGVKTEFSDYVVEGDHVTLACAIETDNGRVELDYCEADIEDGKIIFLDYHGEDQGWE